MEEEEEEETPFRQIKNQQSSIGVLQSYGFGLEMEWCDHQTMKTISQIVILDTPAEGRH